MKLTKYQRLLLDGINEDKTWHYPECNATEKRSLNIMALRGVVHITDHERPIVYLTSKGESLI